MRRERGPRPLGLRILLTIADAEHDLREALRGVFVTRGWSVTTAQTRRDVLHSLRRSGPFDLLVFSEELPRVVGLDALPKAREVGVEAPALLLSGSLALTRGESHTLCVSTLRKPVGAQAVVDEIERLLKLPAVEKGP